jgi:hypothetical protein
VLAWKEKTHQFGGAHPMLLEVMYACWLENNKAAVTRRLGPDCTGQDFDFLGKHFSFIFL